MTTPRKRKEDSKHSNEENGGAKLLQNKTRSRVSSKSNVWVAILATFGIIILAAYFGYQSNPNTNIENTTEIENAKEASQPVVSDKIDDEYAKAVERKVSARVQSGWFKPNETAILRVKSPKSPEDIPGLIKEMSSLSWPSKSSILGLSDSFPIFHWDLTMFSNSNRKGKSYPMLPHCRYQIDPVFVLGSERDKGGMVGSKHDQAVMYVNVSMGDFLKATFREKMYLYWTGELSLFEQSFNLTSNIPSEWQKESKLTRWDDFHVVEPNLEILEDTDEDSEIKDQDLIKSNSSESNKNDQNAKTHEKKSLVRPMLWLSHPGVVAQTHYDTQHNIFVQIQGFKRFYLFPPATELYVYPNIHHAFRQSQIHFERPKPTDKDVFELVNENSVEAIEVTLGPGDILYIPPFWQHRVESLTLSLSLSILSPSEVEAAIAELFWLQVPFGGELQKTRSLRIRAVVAYIDTLFQQLQSDFDSSLPPNHEENSISNVAIDEHATMGEKTGSELRHRFAQSLYLHRFAPLQKLKAVPLTDTPRLCPISDTNIVPSNGGSDNQEVQQIADAQGNFLEAASHFVENLQRLDADTGIKRTFLRDYLEHLVRWAVGPQLTAETLLRCF